MGGEGGGNRQHVASSSQAGFYPRLPNDARKVSVIIARSPVVPVERLEVLLDPFLIHDAEVAPNRAAKLCRRQVLLRT